MFEAGRRAEVSAALKHALCQDSVQTLVFAGLLKMRRKGLGGSLGGSLELHLGRKRGRGLSGKLLLSTPPLLPLAGPLQPLLWFPGVLESGGEEPNLNLVGLTGCSRREESRR